MTTSGNADAKVTILSGDMLDTLKGLPKECVDAVVCDPPYGLSFMGKEWDHEVPGPQYWRRIWHRMKPGAHLVAFSSSRTYHHLAIAIEQAGFELRDQLMWLYGSGMPKGQDLSKAMDKTAYSAELWDAIRAHLREWMLKRGMTKKDLNAAVGSSTTGGGMAAHWVGENTQPEIPSKVQWEKLRGLMGWPAGDLDAAYDAVKEGADRPVVGVARLQKGMCFGTENFGREGGTHDVYITASATDAAKAWEGWNTTLKPAHEPIVLARKPITEPNVALNVRKYGTGGLNIGACRIATTDELSVHSRSSGENHIFDDFKPRDRHQTPGQADGRWPPNVIIDEAAATLLDEQSGTLKSGKGAVKRASSTGYQGNALGKESRPPGTEMVCYGDSGGASRFFYCSKAKASDRAGSKHPTVKPIDVMRWLVRLVTPPGGVVLDAFAGSGTTGEAALAEGHDVILCEKEPEHIEQLHRRFEGRKAGVPAA